MAHLRDSWRTSLPVSQQPRNPQPESIPRNRYESRRRSGPRPLRTRDALLGGEFLIELPPGVGPALKSRRVGGPPQALAQAHRQADADEPGRERNGGAPSWAQ